MTQPNNPAHPTSQEGCTQGMTIREAFAMAAMQGLIRLQPNREEDVAKQAVAHADALIRALNHRG